MSGVCTTKSKDDILSIFVHSTISPVPHLYSV